MDAVIAELTKASTDDSFLVDDCCKPQGIAQILDPKYCYRTSLAKAFYQAQSFYKQKNPS